MQNGTQPSSGEETQDTQDTRVIIDDSDATARPSSRGDARDPREELNSSLDTGDTSMYMSDELSFEDNTKMSDHVTEYDTSKIPFQYQLSLRYLYAINDRYDYVISSFPEHESNFATRDVYDVHDNSTTNLNATEHVELGLLISRSLRILTPGFYEVQEDRYLPNGTMHRVITATASYTSLIYVAWAPPITIKFVTSNESTYNDLTSCEYQFIWTFILNGYVNRRCKNESRFITISYVKGSSLFGFAFYNMNESEVYAYTTIPDLAVWDFFIRLHYETFIKNFIVKSSIKTNILKRRKVILSAEKKRREKVAVIKSWALGFRKGGLGDCWFLVALAAIEDFPRVIKSIAVARDETNGVRNSNCVGTIVDDHVIVKQDGHYYYSEYACRRETWASLLEKAYAKIHGGYGNLDGENWEKDIGGQTRVVYKCSDILSNQIKNDALWQSLLGRNNNQIAFGCGTRANPFQNDEVIGIDGLVFSHAYSVSRAVKFHPYESLNVQLVEVRNPWANTVWKRLATKLKYLLDDDSSFFMTYDDFLTHFEHIESCAFQFAGKRFEIFSDPLDFPDKKQTIEYYKLPPVVNELSMTLRLNIHQRDPNWTLIFHQGADTKIRTPSFWLTNLAQPHIQLSTNNSPMYGIYSIGNGLILNQWYHIGYTLSEIDKCLKFYIDGKLAGFTNIEPASTHNIAFNKDLLRIGHTPGQADLKGKMSNFRYYNWCLSPEEIKKDKLTRNINYGSKVVLVHLTTGKHLSTKYVKYPGHQQIMLICNNRDVDLKNDAFTILEFKHQATGLWVHSHEIGNGRTPISKYQQVTLNGGAGSNYDNWIVRYHSLNESYESYKNNDLMNNDVISLSNQIFNKDLYSHSVLLEDGSRSWLQ
ncbi:15806_t:CDS:10 [Cetraspora pellucida]|uniref:15806_t:CDS:1 n=1 Tax=Cetraspora pellucida TaxID=1433469 RepID=A0A9N9FK57_9GLOM|nr:15806_t:CDS:10 [Cetraspora pellucida]